MMSRSSAVAAAVVPSPRGLEGWLARSRRLLTLDRSRSTANTRAWSVPSLAAPEECLEESVVTRTGRTQQASHRSWLAVAAQDPIQRFDFSHNLVDQGSPSGARQTAAGRIAAGLLVLRGDHGQETMRVETSRHHGGRRGLQLLTPTLVRQGSWRVCQQTQESVILHTRQQTYDKVPS